MWELARARLPPLALTVALCVFGLLAPRVSPSLVLLFDAAPVASSVIATQYDTLVLKASDQGVFCGVAGCLWNFTCGNQTEEAFSSGAVAADASFTFPIVEVVNCSAYYVTNGTASSLSNFLIVDARPFPFGSMTFSPASTYVTQQISLNAIWTSGGSFVPSGRFTFLKASTPSGTLTAFATTGQTSATSVSIPPVLTNPFTTADLIGGLETNVSIYVRIENAQKGLSLNAAPITLTLYPQPVASLVVAPLGDRTVSSVLNMTILGANTVNSPPLTIAFSVVRVADSASVAAYTLQSAHAPVSISQLTTLNATALAVPGVRALFKVVAKVTDGVGAQTALINSPSFWLNPLAVANLTLQTAATAGVAVTAVGSITGGTPPFAVAIAWTRDDGTTVSNSSFAVAGGNFSLNSTLDATALALPGVAVPLTLSVTLTDASGVATGPFTWPLTLNPPLSGWVALAPAAQTTVGLNGSIAALFAGGTAPFSCQFWIVDGGAPDTIVAGPLTPPGPPSAATGCSLPLAYTAAMLSVATQNRTLRAAVLVTDSVGATLRLTNVTGPALVLFPALSLTVGATPNPLTVGRTLTVKAGGVAGGAPGPVAMLLRLVAAFNGSEVWRAAATVSVAPGNETRWSMAVPAAGLAAGAVAGTLNAVVDATDGNGAVVSTVANVALNALPSAVAQAVAAATGDSQLRAGEAVRLSLSGRLGGTGPLSAAWSLYGEDGLTLLAAAVAATAEDSAPTALATLSAAVLGGRSSLRLRFGAAVTDSQGAAATAVALSQVLVLVPAGPPSPPSPPPPSPPAVLQAVVRAKKSNGWPWWLVLVVVAAAACCLLSLILLVVLLLRRRSERLPKRVESSDEDALPPAPYTPGKSARAAGSEPIVLWGQGEDADALPMAQETAPAPRGDMRRLFDVPEDEDPDYGPLSRLFPEGDGRGGMPLKPPPPIGLNAQVLSSDANLPRRPAMPRFE